MAVRLLSLYGVENAELAPGYRAPKGTHQCVREAARDVGPYSVSACLPVAVMGVYVLLPDSL